MNKFCSIFSQLLHLFPRNEFHQAVKKTSPSAMPVVSAQEPQVQQSMKVRSALDALARDTAQLAERGNPNAKLLVEELRRRDIVINPNAPGPQQAPQK